MRRQGGSILKRGSVYYVIYRSPEGKQKWESGFPNKVSARTHLNEVLTEINRGTYLEPKPITFAEFAENYLSSRHAIRGSTSAGYASIIRRHLIPYFGKMKLQDIGLESVRLMVKELIPKVSTKTLRNCITLLRVMLASKKDSSAIKQGYIRFDPLQGLELPSVISKEIVVPTAENVWKLIDTAMEMKSIGHGMIYLGAFAGVRRGELLALCFENIDWFQKELIINRSLAKCRATDGVHKWAWRVSAPKTKTSKRRVALTNNVLQFLSNLKQFSGKSEGLIFSDNEGKPIDPDKFDEDIFAAIRGKAGLTSVRFHDLRHFFASMLIAQGESPKYVSDQLGHSSVQITFDIYGHLFPQAKAEASEKFEERMLRAREEASVSKLLASEEEGNSKEEKPKRVN
ncbi:MAG: site-specific integrase [Terriglobia bacterium]